jgi:signal transduction histidine kinase
LTKFRALIQTNDIETDSKKKQLLQEADRVERLFRERQETLLLPAGVGLTASVAMHEIDKLVPQMEETIKSTPVKVEKLALQIQELKSYMEGILSMLKKGGDSEINIEESINQAIANYGAKLKVRHIQVEVKLQDGVNSLNCDKRYFITMLMNLIDNSIHWLGTTYSEKKEIYISVFDEDKYTHVVVADNGPGFEDDVIEIVKPFHSRRKGGMGLGLYIIDTVMVKYGKLLIHSDLSNLNNNVPKGYSGAVVDLAFKKSL